MRRRVSIALPGVLSYVPSSMPEGTPTPVGSALSKPISLCVLLAALAASFILHRHASFTLPLPWPDESVFLWPAKMLAEQGTWIAPQLNSTRPILWMPPGYTLFMAAVFRWAPFTLAVARSVSWVLSACALTGLFYLHQRQRGALWSLALVGAIAITPTWVVLGNIARMEALLFCIVVWGFVLLPSTRPWKGLALLALAPLIHPNGILFLAAGIISVTFTQHRSGTRFKISDGITGGVVMLAYFGYSALVLRYPEAFLHDMRYQLARKASTWSVTDAFLAPRTLVLALGIFGAGAASLLVWRRPRPTLWLMVASCTIPILSGEMWYLVFGSIGILLLLAEWLDIAASIDLEQLRSIWPRLASVGPLLRFVLLIAVCAASLRLARWLDVTASPHDFPKSLTWECMKMQTNLYMEPFERRAVIDAISQLAHREGARRIGFDPPSDGLFLQPEHTADYLPFFPIFSDVKYDLLVMHVTPSWSDCEPEHESRVQANMKTSRVLFQYQRDPDHRWYIFQPSVRVGFDSTP